METKTVKLLSKNIGKRLHDISLGNDFLAKTPKAQTTKAKVNKWDHIKTKRPFARQRKQ